MTGITLPTTQEQRKRPQAIGLHLFDQGPDHDWEEWNYGSQAAVRLRSKWPPKFYEEAPVEVRAGACVILGLVWLPRGMVMVPREIAEAAESTMLLAETDLRKSARTYKRRGWTACSQHTAERAEELAKHREQLHAILNPPASPEVKKGAQSEGAGQT